MTSVKGRRHPPPVPALSKMDVTVAMHRLEEWLRSLKEGFSGLPAEHAATHLAGGPDALDTPGTPTDVTVNVSADVGGGTTYAYEDHQHGLDLGLTTKGDLLSRSTIYTRLGVGANGTVLEADSTAAAGLKWGTVAGDGELVAWLALMGF